MADAGYHSGAALAACARRGQRVAMPEAQARALQQPYHKDRFVYDAASDSYRCPAGQRLRFTRHKRTRGVPMRLYRVSGAVCRACPAFGVCTTDGRHGRGLEIGPPEAVLRRHRAWMATREAQHAYQQRQHLVEPVFGIIKEQLRARRFLLRGLANVTAEWALLATAFNLRTLWRLWRAPPPQPRRVGRDEDHRRRGHLADGDDSARWRNLVASPAVTRPGNETARTCPHEYP